MHTHMSFVTSLGSKIKLNVDVQIPKASGDIMSTEFGGTVLNCFVVVELKHEPTCTQLGKPLFVVKKST